MNRKNYNLPNSAHISGVIASVWANPYEWSIALDATRRTTPDLSWDRAWYPAWMTAWEVAKNSNRRAQWLVLTAETRLADWPKTARSSARCAISALLAYDDCVHMLDSAPDELHVLSKLGADAATLILPAAVAFKLIREKQNPVL
jgi:hypothetical protein